MNIVILPANGSTKHRTGYWIGNNFILHNPKGPAIEYHDGDVLYYICGELHRLDGPAYISPKLRLERWYYKGEKIPVKSQEAFKEFIKGMK